ncbi:enhanced serine sensitivity protein SseB [Actinoplanes sp. KI2]|uniref:enhanced serine sensitivity protein SseB n=1 Tax=Actinoplanes sp. KI2 TaxID=2983315 RepID=UPI0021D5D980|nr:enhanced serine sensitivity protein SseB [Actinoplanes sp. KI2]MCU7729200.1 enhanced serine sensitivity protein SseB [Actinoplanes sp. KI2]
MAFPANELEQALASARAGSMSPDRLLQALADNPLWVPLPAGADAQGNAQLPVLVLDGRPYVAAYTSAEQFAVGAGPAGHLELTGKQLAALLAGDLGLAVNPGAEHGLPVNPDGVRALRGGRTTVRAGGRLRLGTPETEPQGLLAALAARFAPVPAVIEARRALAQAGDQPPTLLIGIRADHHDEAGQRHILDAVDAAVADAPLPYGVDTVFLDDPADPITRWLLEHTEPFYTRPAP